jgi:hypothetical protein
MLEVTKVLQNRVRKRKGKKRNKKLSKMPLIKDKCPMTKHEKNLKN